MKCKELKEQIDSKELMQMMRDVTSFHRIQASPEYRKAAVYCKEVLEASGIDTKLLILPADKDSHFDTFSSFEEWDCREAWCKLEDGTILSDYSAQPMSIIQKSIGCDYRKEAVELVLFDETIESYEGKVVFSHEPASIAYDRAVLKGKAVGIITDYMDLEEGIRKEEEMADLYIYSSFWWQKNKPRCFGFVITPNQGKMLEKRCKDYAVLGKKLFLNAYIDAKLYPGTIECVTAVIPGMTKEEILITAHLCHPTAGANDNASGVCAGIETMLSIQRYIKQEKSVPLKRGIRLLLMPELTGSYGFLTNFREENQNCIAGINLDMVGAYQNQDNGPLILHRLPKGFSDLSEEVAEMAVAEVKKEHPLFMTSGSVSHFQCEVREFSPGSDNQVFSDPMVGIPCVSLGQWPDKYYHTSGDTLENIDPYVLERAAQVAFLYVMKMATLKNSDCDELIRNKIIKATSEMLRLNREIEGKQNYQDKIARIYEIVENALNLSKKYAIHETRAEQVAMETKIQENLDTLKRITEVLVKENLYESAKICENSKSEQYDYIPVRRFHTPIAFFQMAELREGDAEYISEFWEISNKLPAAIKYELIFYVDGVHTAGEIMRTVQLDFDVQLEKEIHEFFMILKKLKIIDISNENKGAKKSGS